MSTDREQELVNLCYSLVLTCTNKKQKDHFLQKSTEERAEWIRMQLNSNGFPTTPLGSSWGILDD